MQPVDFTTLMAVLADLQTNWIPARLEKVYQDDRHTVMLALRTLQGRGWLTISWHPQAARLHMGDPPPRTPDTFTFSQQLQHQLQSLALTSIAPIAPWERTIDLQFAQRPGEQARWHLYLEIMGKYSNVVLTNADNLIVTAAHQVSAQQSRLRPIQTGDLYEPPPSQTNPVPNPAEPFASWQARISLVPKTLKQNLLGTYRGLSSALVESLVRSAALIPTQATASLADADWQRLYDRWLTWLDLLNHQAFQPGYTQNGYTVLGWDLVRPVDTIQTLLHHYYTQDLSQQDFQQLHHRLSQKVGSLLAKLNDKLTSFQTRLDQSDQADIYRDQANLLMAHLHEWQPGLKTIDLPDFSTGEPITITLDPEKNAVQNAQVLYRQHQKLKRAREAVTPLLQAVQEEVTYLQQIEVALRELTQYNSHEDSLALAEIRDELIQQNYLESADYRGQTNGTEADFRRFLTPSGFELCIGRNNHQNDRLTFRFANQYDLWFHAQEVPGSHVLLRPAPGAEITTADLQQAANMAAYYSRARYSEQVPVVYTSPNNVYKPKGARPGTAIYKKEQIIWGRPQQVASGESN